ncbi:MAG: hypothetical protein QW699_01975 [Metallosphaera sp.]|uniref:hypothetical protein n=1 Tax=Metallosphaera sp. TaxID=2020860 RepID=UPI003181DF97
MTRAQVTEYVRETIEKQGYDKRLVLPVKMLSSIEATLNVALPVSVSRVIAVTSQNSPYCEKIKDVLSRIRPNAYSMCIFDEIHPSNIVSLFYK